MLLDDNPLQRSHLIAGSTSGKPVYITPNAKPKYDSLLKLAHRNNYWAVVTIKGINELVSGRLNMNNIFVHPGSPKRYGNEEFVVLLPGCRVIAERLDSDEFKIIDLEPDLQYFKLMQVAERPGLHKIEHKNQGWQSKAFGRAETVSNERRIVAISDAGYSMVEEACESSVAAIMTSQGGTNPNELQLSGFNLHFTPGEKRLGGLINFRSAIAPNSMKQLNESAILLASAMYHAKDVQGVRWVSDNGGSAVLTQALQILSDQGVKLETHSVFLANPKSSPNQAIKLAHKVGLKLDRNPTSESATNYVAMRDQFNIIYNRLRAEKDYSVAKGAVDATKHVGKATAFAGAAALLGGSAAAALGLPIAAPAIPAALAFLKAIAATSAAAVATPIALAGAANLVTKNVSPSLHRALSRKVNV